MDFDSLLKFIDDEHERLVNHYNNREDPITKYAMLLSVTRTLRMNKENVLLGLNILKNASDY